MAAANVAVSMAIRYSINELVIIIVMVVVAAASPRLLLWMLQANIDTTRFIIALRLTMIVGLFPSTGTRNNPTADSVSAILVTVIMAMVVMIRVKIAVLLQLVMAGFNRIIVTRS